MEDKQSEGLILLKEIKTIDRMIIDLQIQIDEIYSMLTSTTVKPKEVNIMSSGDPDPMATKMCKVLEYQEKLQNYQAELCNKKLIAIQIAQQMSIEHQELINLRYFKGLTIEEIGDKIGYTYRWAWDKIHDAEKEFISIFEKST